MSKPRWTEDQQKIIDLKDCNILVSAAAGSGKTAVLVERIIQMVSDPDRGIDIDRLLVVTFTKAAAGEMRNRIGKALQEKLLENPGDENLERQLGLLHNAQITTIHSFCQNIIKNYFHVIGIDPGFTVVDETELKLLREEVIHDVLEEKYAQARENRDEAFIKGMQVFSLGRNSKKLDELVIRIYEIIRSFPWPEEILQNWESMYEITSYEEFLQKEWMKDLEKSIFAKIKNYIKQCDKAMEICDEPDGPAPYHEAIYEDKEWFKKVLNCKDMEELYNRISNPNFVKFKSCTAKKGYDQELIDQVKNIRNGYKDKITKSLQKDYFFQEPKEMYQDILAMAEPVKQLLQVVREFDQALSQKKAEEGYIDFGDMEHYALQILTNRDEDGTVTPSDIALELREYYQEVLTDEYQDSNFVQESLLTSISRGPEEAPYMFMVGDVKQSIYQFRLARPDLFMSKYKKYQLTDTKEQRIDLKQNFRSRSCVLDSANRIFERIMREDFGGIVYDDSARLALGANYPETECKVAKKTELLVLEKENEENTLLSKREMEAIMIGERILEMVQGDDPLHVLEDGQYRPVQYRDIVILLRSMSGWSDVMQNILSSMGIPVYSATKTGYFSAYEIETIINFLKVLDNPRQDIPLVAVMRSLLGGFEEEELAFIKSTEKGITYWDHIKQILEKEDYGNIPEADREKYRRKLQGFVDHLEKYRRLAGACSVYELLQRVYKETGYYDVMCAMQGGEQKRANLDVLLTYALDFAEHGHQGIFAFCQHINRMKKSSIDFGEPNIFGESANVVQVMSIHKSKGLEFPVVFVAGCGKQFNLMDTTGDVIVDMDCGIGVNYFNSDSRVKIPTLLKKYVASKVKFSTLAEEVRILYVALTRAKEQLIITGCLKEAGKSVRNYVQKGEFIGYETLESARTYLEWIFMALSDSFAMKACIEDFHGADQIENMVLQEDELFSIRFTSLKDHITVEKEEILGEIADEKMLEEFDFSKVYDKDIHEYLCGLEEYEYPYQGEDKIPVKVAVSTLKHQAMEARLEHVEEERPGEIFREETSDISLESVAEPSAEGSSVEAVEKGLEAPKPKFITGIKSQENPGAARGTLYHLVMEHLPYEEMEEDFNFKGFFRKLQEKGYIEPEEVKILRSIDFAKFTKCKLYERMKKAQLEGRLHREQQFMFGIPATEVSADFHSEEMVLVQGIIDAYFEEEDGIVLVDYKTDRVDKTDPEKGQRDLVEKYRKQLELYRDALEQLTEKPVKEMLIYSFAFAKELVID